MNVLVTGGTGFIGSHLVDRLIKLGHNVTTMDNGSAVDHDQRYQNALALNIDVNIARDWQNQVRPFFDGIDYVFHCAAEARIQTAISNPIQTIETNVLGTSIVLQCAKEAGCKRVIFSSSSSVYGMKNKLPFSEDMTPDCLNIYSESKIAGEGLCRVYSNLWNLDTVSLRYFNVYGPREPLKGPHATVVGKFLKQRKNNQPLTVVGDGQQRRDFTHVSDVVNANILAMESNYKFNGEVLNVGTGKNYSVLELAAMISNSIEFVNTRPGEAPTTLADCTKVKQMLGWSSTVQLTSYISGQLLTL